MNSNYPRRTANAATAQIVGSVGLQAVLILSAYAHYWSAHATYWFGLIPGSYFGGRETYALAAVILIVQFALGWKTSRWAKADKVRLILCGSGAGWLAFAIFFVSVATRQSSITPYVRYLSFGLLPILAWTVLANGIVWGLAALLRTPEKAREAVAQLQDVQDAQPTRFEETEHLRTKV